MRSIKAFILAMILLMAAIPALQAQGQLPQEEKKECDTSPSLQQLKAELARKEAWELLEQALEILEIQVDPPTNAPYHLPLTIHIVRRSDGTGGLSLDDLWAAMNDLNHFWRPVGIQFFIYGNIDYINNDTHFNVPNVRANQDALRRVNPVANTINVYFTDLAGLNGQASFTTDAFQGVLMDIGAASVASSPGAANVSTFAHEIGHYFDLYHTHETWPDNMGNPTLVECPRGNNCGSTGDLVCDTPADPGLQASGAFRVDNNCAYDNTAMTPGGCDNTAYNPPTRNLMSYSRAGCRTEFTPEQIRRVLRVLRDTNNRRNLIIRASRYVDPLASERNADCSYNFPCHTVTKGIQVALHGDFIFIKPGAYRAAALQGKRVTLTNWLAGGVVRIDP
ncbi:MAG: M43 family zinc metalloprotease [Acidobacteria bacterium]|nr:M43 family zinc metalloprotease [Acidobacteriota bacterium]